MDDTRGNPGSEPVLINCPGCRKPTASLKRFGILRQVVFVGIYAQARSRPFVACPPCMRKELLRNTLSIKHILLGNLMWLLAILPYNLAMMTADRSPRHLSMLSKKSSFNTSRLYSTA